MCLICIRTYAYEMTIYDMISIMIELLLSILASINGKQWSEIHPEHLRLILLGLKSYNNNLVLDKVLLEILEQCNII